jgi:hypothetical protein
LEEPRDSADFSAGCGAKEAPKPKIPSAAIPKPMGQKTSALPQRTPCELMLGELEPRFFKSALQATRL